jgi:hypothetical protein
MSEWIYWDKEREINLTVENIIRRAKEAGRKLEEVLKGIVLCNPPKTSTYWIGKFDEKTETVIGEETEDDGDRLRWNKKLNEILDYYDIRTISFEWPPRRYPISLQEVRARAID